MIFGKNPKRIAFCLVCGEYLGSYRNEFAQEHLERHPAHKKYLVKDLVDRILPEPSTHAVPSGRSFKAAIYGP